MCRMAGRGRRLTQTVICHTRCALPWKGPEGITESRGNLGRGQVVSTGSCSFPVPHHCPLPWRRPLHSSTACCQQTRARCLHPFLAALWGRVTGHRKQKLNSRWCNESRWLALTWGGHGLRNYLCGPRTAEWKSARKWNVWVRLCVPS